MELSPSRTVKEVHSLTGKIAALNKFISRATEKYLPLFRILKRSFEWTNECQKAFEELKVYLLAPPLLSPSMPGEELFLYLAVSSAAVSAALIREEGKVQRPVYFISRALRGAEERYPQMEKLTFALVTITQKLKPYFQAHTINVLTDKPLRRAMSNVEAARWMALWVIKLSEFDIQYQPRAVVEGQMLADFITEFTIIKDQGAEETPIWRVHTDGSANKHAGGVGVVLHTPEGDRIECMIRLDFSTTNNEAKYEALIVGLDFAIAVGAKSVVVYSDSQIVTSQVNGSYDCKNERMKRYLEKVKGRTNNLQIKMIQIPREENQEADWLTKAASAKPMIIPKQVLSFVQLSSLLDDLSMQEVSNECCWTAPIVAYLKEGKLPDNKEDVRKLKVKAARTMARTPIGETPFRLAYSSEALIPAEVGLTSYHVENYDKSKNDEALRLQLDLVDEVRAAGVWPSSTRGALTANKSYVLSEWTEWANVCPWTSMETWDTSKSGYKALT
ncbi:uncharacterized protein LOC142620836 [Castanea sativa]|uniref:uncharacterized protein LOC142620836 n=1 Tax=Castanea sativa TaxID=21020 RepID=UPI003F64B99F